MPQKLSARGKNSAEQFDLKRRGRTASESRVAVEAAVELVSHVFDKNLRDYSKITDAPSQELLVVSLMVSLADVGVLTGMHDYHRAAQRMWTDIVERKMYITGGVGSTGNEGFGEPYSLPNISAYAETCAVLMSITLNHRMFLATGDSMYIDVMF